VKHVEFCSTNEFEKLVQLIGFIIRIHHDARSPERQINFLALLIQTSKSVLSRFTSEFTARGRFLNNVCCDKYRL